MRRDTKASKARAAPVNNAFEFPLADLPDDTLVIILAHLPVAEQKRLGTVCRLWALDDGRCDLWRGMASARGIDLPKASARSSRSKTKLRSTYFTLCKAQVAAERQALDTQAVAMVAMMKQRDSVLKLQKELDKSPRLAAHEMDPADRDGHATLLHAACRYGRCECAKALLAVAVDAADMIPCPPREATVSEDGARARASVQQLLGCGGGAGSSSRGHETIAGTAKAAEVEAAVADAVAYEANEAARVAVHPLLARKDRGGFTPLLMAAWCGHEDLTMQLLIAGAPTDDVGVPPLTSSCGGKGPFDAATWAERKGYDRIVDGISTAIKDRERERDWHRSVLNINWLRADLSAKIGLLELTLELRQEGRQESGQGLHRI